jgi:hypothetical protein
MDASGNATRTRTVRSTPSVDVSGVQNIVVDISGATPSKTQQQLTRVQNMVVDNSGATLSKAQQQLITLITNATSGNKPRTREDCMALYHTLSVLLGNWVVSELPAAEQKIALAALWLGEELASGTCLPKFFRR